MKNSQKLNYHGLQYIEVVICNPYSLSKETLALYDRYEDLRFDENRENDIEFDSIAVEFNRLGKEYEEIKNW